MNMLPGPAQTAAICLGVGFPLLLLCYARIAAIGGLSGQSAWSPPVERMVA